MAVEAHHLHLFPSQLIPNRESMGCLENQYSIYNTQMGFGTAGAGAGAGCFIPLYNSGAADADASESGLTFNDLSNSAMAATPPPMKRQRGAENGQFSFLGDDISSQIQQQQMEIDRLVAHHTEKVRLELWERRRRLSRLVAAVAEEGVQKRIKAKEEEIEKIGKLNSALEERVKSLSVENQLWRDLAETNEAAAAVLRNNLEQVLAQQAQAREEQVHHHRNHYDTVDDAESCCDNYHHYNQDSNSTANGVEEADELAGRRWRRKVVVGLTCRGCGEEEPSVLLLPCRHLCLCLRCGPVALACPICKCHNRGTVHVNMS